MIARKLVSMPKANYSWKPYIKPLPDSARLAQYTEDGHVVQFSMLCDDVYEGLEWIRENIKSTGIAIYGKELRPK